MNQYSAGLVLSGEVVEPLSTTGLRILQPLVGYRFSLDPVLLCFFAQVRPAESVLDLGTGNGILPLLLRSRTAAGSITAVEIQPHVADRARRTMRLNGLEEGVQVLQGDVRTIRHLVLAESLDLVVANPPYRKVGAGRLPPMDERAAARHELHGTLTDFILAAAWGLRQGGRLAVVYPVERLTELLATMHAERIEPKRLRLVYSRPGSPARLALVEGRRNGRQGLTVESPLYIYRASEGRCYSAEMQGIYDGVPA